MGEDDTKSTKTTRSKKSGNDKSVAPTEDEGAPVSVVEEEESFKEFLWNSERKEFLGRTGKSWLDITIFYTIFFLSLYAFFMLQWYSSLLFIDHDKPYKRGKDALLYASGPGLTFRPVPDRTTNGISTLIWFNPGKAEGHRFWSDQLKNWFKSIPSKDSKAVSCEGDKKATNKQACLIEKSKYGHCDGSDPNFGYSRGEPCILLKLNRIYEWAPEPKKQSKIEKEEPGLKEYFQKNGYSNKLAYIWCEGEHDHDKENLGSIEYFPGPYLEMKHFPFLKQKDYQTPFVMIKLRRPMAGTLLSFICRIHANNVEPDRESGVGYARFEVLMGSA